MTNITRILYVVSDLLEGRGGIQSVVMSIYQHLNLARVQIDFVIHVDEQPSFVPAIKKMGGKIYRAPQFKKVGPWAYIRWWNRFYKEHPQYQIVHGHMPTYASIYLGIAKKYKRTTICHCHTAFPVAHGMTKMVRFLLHYPLRWVVDYHFACSVAAGEYLFGKKIVKKPSFRVISNARDTQLFSYNPSIRQQMREKLGLTKCLVVGHIGRMMEVKNHTFLLNIFAEIYKRNSQARLLLVGDGPLKRQLFQQTQQLGLTQAVLFVGNIDNPHDYYQAMDVFVFPSLYEGLGMTLIEAQIAGLPCVFSANLPAEVNLQTGLCHRVSLKESADKWVEIILVQQDIKRVSHAKEASEKGFEITAAAKQLEDFYISLEAKYESNSDSF